MATTVHLRPLDETNRAGCLSLEAAPHQQLHVASVQQSLDVLGAQDKPPGRSYIPLAIFDCSALGWEKPPMPPIGFAMLQISAGVGFMRTLLIDRRSQDKGYGRDAVVQLVRRLYLHPDVEMVATSCPRDNARAVRFFTQHGFVPWQTEWAKENPDEMFLMLPQRWGP